MTHRTTLKGLRHLSDACSSRSGSAYRIEAR